MSTKEKPASPYDESAIEIYYLRACKFDAGRWLIHMYPFSSLMLNKVKSIPGRKYHHEIKTWSIPRTRYSLMKVQSILGEKVQIQVEIKTEELPDGKPIKKNKSLENKKWDTLLPPQLQVLLTKYVQYLEQHRYGRSTVKSYRIMVTKFLLFFEKKDWMEINEADIRLYNHETFIKGSQSFSTQNQFISAIKLFFTLNRNEHIIPQDLQRPRKNTTLPNVLSKEEVKRIIKATANIKHKCLLSLIYGAGLRIGEALRIEIKDIRSDEKLIYIRQSKGAKDRRVPLSETMLKLLREYYKKYRPKRFIFEGQYGGQYSPRSAQQVLKRACKKANIKVSVTLHTLRHSYATHLLEQGVGLRYIQEILGHNSPRTTMIYTHISGKRLGEVRSPIEDLDL